MKLENIYTSVGCNRTPENADWGLNNLVIFGACNAVVIFENKPDGACKIIQTYVEHSNRINTVKWIKHNGQPEHEFITGSDDCTAIIWNIKDIANPKINLLKGHESGVTAVEATYVRNRLLAVTGSADSTIKCWLCTDLNNFDCSETINLNGGFCFNIKMILIPGTEQLLMAYAADDDKVHMLAENIEEDENVHVKFTRVHSLIGHEDWVRGLEFVVANSNDILLASSSQDTFIRLWRISRVPCEGIPCSENADIQIEGKLFTIKVRSSGKLINHNFAVSLESVLQCHEGWVYSVNWNITENGLQLLSSSIDKTLAIWAPSEEGVWIEKARLGEIGGNSLGFFGAKFGNNGRSILSHGFQGSFHIWNQSKIDKDLWEPAVIIGGHFDDVRDLSWEPKGNYLFSVSADQTTRIHGPWIRKTVSQTTWHEIARPQVHGYDIQCIAVLSSTKFASGAEEKIVRTFSAPENFIENLKTICQVSLDENTEPIPKGASVPSLGLSNKAVYNCEEEKPTSNKNEYPENYFTPTYLETPPQEETLMQNTLWPEIQKLYGHGFEIFTLCSSADGKFLASACKATNAEHAQIIIWDTKNWKQIQKLYSHQLTVTQMKFSMNNEYLLSVSRDRRWSLFATRCRDNTCSFELVATTDKKNGIHSRIIWSCDWSHDSKYFVTTSRDGKAVAWCKGTLDQTSSLKEWRSDEVLDLKKESITAVAFAPKLIDEQLTQYLVAFGFENGRIQLYSYAPWKHLYTLNRNIAHHSVVKKLHFRPNCEKIQLASCGEDHFVRIYNIIF